MLMTLVAVTIHTNWLPLNAHTQLRSSGAQESPHPLTEDVAAAGESAGGARALGKMTKPVSVTAAKGGYWSEVVRSS